MNCPHAVFFDLDDTLAESFHAPSPEVLAGLGKLLESIPVSIITGSSFQRMHEQFLTALESYPRIDRLYIFPTSSAQAYTYTQGEWRILYNLALTEDERSRIKKAVWEAVTGIKELSDIPHYGEQMIDKEAQIAYTHVGVDAPRAVKDVWDTDGSKRGLLWKALKESLPDFEILMGGVTTIDITRKDVNKSYGVGWLSKTLSISPERMLYVGDALYPGGNDAVVIPTGIQTRSVAGPDETQKIIQELLVACDA